MSGDPKIDRFLAYLLVEVKSEAGSAVKGIRIIHDGSATGRISHNFQGLGAEGAEWGKKYIEEA